MSVEFWRFAASELNRAEPTNHWKSFKAHSVRLKIKSLAGGIKLIVILTILIGPFSSVDL